MQKTTLYLPDDVRTGLRELARRERRSQADLIRDALRRYLEASGRPTPSSIGMGEDGELAASETEDWLRARWGKD